MNNMRRQSHRYSYWRAVNSSQRERAGNTEVKQAHTTAFNDSKNEQPIDNTFQQSTSENNNNEINNNKEMTQWLNDSINQSINQSKMDFLMTNQQDNGIILALANHAPWKHQMPAPTSAPGGSCRWRLCWSHQWEGYRNVLLNVRQPWWFHYGSLQKPEGKQAWSLSSDSGI